MAAGLTLIEQMDTTRNLYLFDTFDGMTPPTDHDVSPDGHLARELLDVVRKSDGESLWCRATIDEAQATMQRSGYNPGRVFFVQGRVEETIPEQAPARIALLRLDTDWYESTRHELEHLYPRLSSGGVLIIDDYGHWAGCRQAVDEYADAGKLKVLLNRIDYTGRIAIKMG